MPENTQSAGSKTVDAARCRPTRLGSPTASHGGPCRCRRTGRSPRNSEKLDRVITVDRHRAGPDIRCEAEESREVVRVVDGHGGTLPRARFRSASTPRRPCRRRCWRNRCRTKRDRRCLRWHRLHVLGRAARQRSVEHSGDVKAHGFSPMVARVHAQQRSARARRSRLHAMIEEWLMALCDDCVPTSEVDGTGRFLGCCHWRTGDRHHDAGRVGQRFRGEFSAQSAAWQGPSLRLFDLRPGGNGFEQVREFRLAGSVQNVAGNLLGRPDPGSRRIVQHRPLREHTL